MDNLNLYSDLSDEQLQGIHAACESFERALGSEEPIRIEDCMELAPEGLRAPLFRELLAIEIERQLPQDGPDHIAAFGARFPDRIADIERVVEEIAKAAKSDCHELDHGPVTVSVSGYEIEGVLGRGSMGVVYKARHLRLKRTVALKMILAGRHSGSREWARFRIEAEAVARLQHPNFVQIHEVGETDGHPYCALEFVEGGNLACKLDGTPMPPQEAAKLLETLARAMHLAHCRNVVHRDLKPANILLTADGIPKITDFGLARQTDIDSGETQAGAVMGTPAYMAPEQASGHGHDAGPAADVYALGAILYDCLTGQPPFKGTTIVATLDLVRTQEPTPPSRWQKGVPLDLETICLKCLRKEPENRYSSAAELGDELVRYQRGEPILARPIGAIERTVKWAKRHRAASWAATAVMLVFAAAAFAIIAIQDRAEERRQATHAAGLVQSLLNADIAQVPAIIREIDGYRKWADPLLREAGDHADAKSRQKLFASLALVPVDATHVDYLCSRLLDAQPLQVAVICQSLVSHQDGLTNKLWAAVISPEKGKESQRLRAAAALAKFDPQSANWTNAQKDVVNDLVAAPAVYSSMWLDALRPVRRSLFPQLSAIFADDKRRETERTLATEILGEYAADDPRELAELVKNADEKQFALFLPLFKEHVERGLPVLAVTLEQSLPAELPSSSEKRERLAKQQANAAVTLLHMNQPEKVWPLLVHSQDPRVRSYLVDRFGPFGVDASLITQRFKIEPDVTIRRSLLLCLGNFSEQSLSLEARKTLLPQLQAIYRTDDDPGLHAAAEWLLRTWKQQAWLKQHEGQWVQDKTKRDQRFGHIQQLMATANEKKTPQWFVNSQGQTLVVLPGPVEFLMGSPVTETDRLLHESQHTRKIARTFALAATPVTKEQFLQFAPAFTHDQMKRYPEPTCAIGGVTWFEAARYCNWLSQQEGIAEDQWCYEVGKVNLKANYLSLSGYRLPTEAEMEYATRAGALTSRYYGETAELLHKYEWYLANAQNRTWPVGSLKPNDFGFFDMNGHVMVWCQGSFQKYSSNVIDDKEEPVLTVEPSQARYMRGGAYDRSAAKVRSAYRDDVLPNARIAFFGFRVARTITP